MFTGIVEETGQVAELARSSSGARLVVAAREVLEDLEVGGSIAVNGCCLTAVEIGDRSFVADLSPETLGKTNLGSLGPGSIVNLERPLLPTSRLSGHFVLGHVDGTGRVQALEPVGDGNWWLSVRVPDDLLKYLVYKGSIAIDGISLTVASVAGTTIGIAIIPHTYEVTALSRARAGTEVNIECDMIAKHLRRLLAAGCLPAGKAGGPL